MCLTVLMDVKYMFGCLWFLHADSTCPNMCNVIDNVFHDNCWLFLHFSIMICYGNSFKFQIT